MSLELLEVEGDGKDYTLLAVEAAEAVPWTKPVDLVYDPKQPIPPLGDYLRMIEDFPEPSAGTRRPRTTALFAGCATRYLYLPWPNDDPDYRSQWEKVVRAIITWKGGEQLGDKDDIVD
jgi:hypothetical protein